MDDEQIGEHRLSEYARSQLESARHDPRLDRSRTSPFADFQQAVDEIIRVRLTTRIGAEALAEAEIRGVDAHQRQVAWERRELGQAEIDGDFGWLNASTLVALHGALDTLVEGVGPATDGVVVPLAAREMLSEVLAEKAEEYSAISEDYLEAFVDVVASLMLGGRKYETLRSNGAERWENVLRHVNFALPDDQPVPEDLSRALTEACVLRDVLVHRGGRVDTKAAKACASLGFEVDEFIRLPTRRTRELSAAIIAYGLNVTHRAAARFGAGEAPHLNEDWRTLAPLF